MSKNKFNIFEELQEKDILVFTTNGVVKHDKRLVMGRGIAYEVKKRFPNIDKILGEKVLKEGNKVYFLGNFKLDNKTIGLISFPTKKGIVNKKEISINEVLPRYINDFLNSKKDTIEGWKLYSDKNLIEKSLKELTEINFKEYKRLYLPIAGTENGGLKEKDILKLYNKYLNKIKINSIIIFNRNGIVKKIKKSRLKNKI